MKIFMRKEQHPLDDTFRRGLEDYQVMPTREQRSAVLRKAEEEMRKGSSSGWRIAGFSAALLLVTGLVVWIMVSGDRDAGRNEESQVKGGASSGLALAPRGSVLSTLPAKGRETQENEANATSEQTLPEPATSLTSHITGAPDVSRDETPENTPVQTLLNDSTQKPTPAETTALFPETVPPLTTVVLAQKDPEVATKPEVAPPAVVRSQKTSLPRDWNVTLGLYYTPEWMFNTLNGEKFVNNAGFEGTFHFGRYSVSTGMGLSMTVGSNELLVKTNPFKGTYTFLDSITFNWDQQHYNLVANYFTTDKSVYDTTLQNSISSVKKRYTYLQVPLVLGYDFWQDSRFSVGIRGGAVMSVLLKTENLSGAYDAGNDRIISINDISPDRISLNWQAVAGISASLKLSERFSLELEPDVRYYFNSVYESSVITKKPWSIGLKSAFLVKL